MLVMSIGVLAVGGFFSIRFYKAYSQAPAEVAYIDPPSMDDVMAGLVEERASKLIDGGSETIDFGSESEINVLLLGLDARKHHHEPHCDAIHMMTLDIENWTIKITSVPRGTYSYIPPGSYATSEYYVSNACAFAGLDYGVEQIERIAGVKADYVATVGFSEVIGIARFFNLPTTETLQWLRHRQSYAIGDPQRSHNQAVFIKDMIVGHLGKFRNDFSVPMQYVLYNMVDTDMDFKMARTLLQGYMNTKIDDRPDDIELTMRPWYPTVDYHLDPENAAEQIDALVDFLKPYLPPEDLSLRSIESVQEELIGYLELRLDSGEPVDDVLEKQLWLQVEDEETREELHYQYFLRYLETLEEDQIIDTITLYILEKETFGLEESAERGEDLLLEYM